MIWFVVLAVILGFLFGFFSGGIYSRNKIKRVGTIVVDKVNPTVNGGVYSVFDADPMTFSSGDLISMDVIVADLVKRESQQNQGT